MWLPVGSLGAVKMYSVIDSPLENSQANCLSAGSASCVYVQYGNVCFFTITIISVYNEQIYNLASRGQITG